jgi:TldD protein
MVELTRRELVTAGAVALAATVVPYRLAGARAIHASVPRAGSPALRALADAALDAAARAGATYADVRFEFGQIEEWRFTPISASLPTEEFTISVGVRALVNGYWGFASRSGLVTADDMARLGHTAADSASTSALGPARHVELALRPVVSDGMWTTPITRDPFAMRHDEKADFMCATCEFVARQRYGTSARARVRFVRDERTFASSDGSFITQTVYNTGGTFEVQVKPNWKTHIAAGQPAAFFTNASAGWEYVERAPFRDRALELIERAEQKCTPTPVEIGR